MKTLDLITGALVVIGALNWGLVALAEFDLVAAIAGLSFGETNAFTRIVYALVGVSGLYQIFSLVERARQPEAVTAGRSDRSSTTRR
jgi:uncharacterized protein